MVILEYISKTPPLIFKGIFAIECFMDAIIWILYVFPLIAINNTVLVLFWWGTGFSLFYILFTCHTWIIAVFLTLFASFETRHVINSNLHIVLLFLSALFPATLYFLLAILVDLLNGSISYSILLLLTLLIMRCLTACVTFFITPVRSVFSALVRLIFVTTCCSWKRI